MSRIAARGGVACAFCAEPSCALRRGLAHCKLEQKFFAVWAGLPDTMRTALPKRTMKRAVLV